MSKRRGGRFAALAAVVFFAALAGLPWLFTANTSPPWVQSAQNTSAVPLPAAPQLLSAVQLSSVATPIQPDGQTAAQPTVDATHSAALVAGEDNRLRTLLHHSSRMVAPAILVVPGALPTLVLTARPDPYTLTDLLSARAVVPLGQVGGYLLVDSVLVRPSASLKLGGADGMSTLLMDSTTAGFSSLVTWGGTLELAGQSTAALNITGWDEVNNQAAQDRGYGRPYIRAVGGRLDLTDVHASSLGFWSGRTGGVAWTGISTRASSGGAVSSTFIGNTYGAFVSRSAGVGFNGDLFESNELDGLRLHNKANNSTITSSAAVRNGGNGFVVSRGATADVLYGDVAIHNAGNGFLLNGQPLVNGASPSGASTTASIGTVVEFGDAENNGRTGILVEGGSGTMVRNNIVCGVATAIAVRSGASATSVLGNEVRCGLRVALSIGPAVTGTTISGNMFEQARIGLLIRNSPGVRLMTNQFDGITVFGISVRGASPGVVGNDNTIAGKGFQPIDVRGGAPAVQLTATNTKDWVHSSTVTVLSYLRFHPLLSTWVAILLLVIISWIVVRLRRRPAAPYRHTVPWQSSQQILALANGYGLVPVTGLGNGHAPGSGSGHDHSVGDSSGNGHGNGTGHSNGHGNGSGNGNGNGYGQANGNGNGNGHGVRMPVLEEVTVAGVESKWHVQDAPTLEQVSSNPLVPERRAHEGVDLDGVGARPAPDRRSRRVGGFIDRDGLTGRPSPDRRRSRLGGFRS
ncbi:MAG TPA: right-handed parallel beta-helix repeat-containing protein [Candidatus Dormibacteraeota bacterium]